MLAINLFWIISWIRRACIHTGCVRGRYDILPVLFSKIIASFTKCLFPRLHHCHHYNGFPYSHQQPPHCPPSLCFNHPILYPPVFLCSQWLQLQTISVSVCLCLRSCITGRWLLTQQGVLSLSTPVPHFPVENHRIWLLHPSVPWMFISPTQNWQTHKRQNWPLTSSDFGQLKRPTQQRSCVLILRCGFVEAKYKIANIRLMWFWNLS